MCMRNVQMEILVEKATFQYNILITNSTNRWQLMFIFCWLRMTVLYTQESMQKNKIFLKITTMNFDSIKEYFSSSKNTCFMPAVGNYPLA